MTDAWRAKANRIIAKECLESWKSANMFPDGRRRKRHVPYSVPVTSANLVRCLAENDEAGAKHIFQRLALGLPGVEGG